MILLNKLLIHLAALILGITVLLALVNLVLAKATLIKLVILEVVANLILAAICIFSVIYQYYIYLDVCIALALLMFLSTVAYVQFLSNREA